MGYISFMATARELKNYKAKLRAKKRITASEAIAKRLLEEDGRQFAFQTILGFFITDFIILDKALVVEIDGGYHNTAYQKWYDNKRDIFITRCGLKVLHIPNEEAHLIVEKIAEYPYVVGWEKKIGHARGYANALKHNLTKRAKETKGQPKLL